MNTGQLECFVQVADNLSFRRAADELHLSQPAVSKQVAALEAELGGALFVRTTRSVALTALGEAFLPDAREMLRIMYASKERASRGDGRASLSIGYSDPSELGFLAQALEGFREERPQAAVRLVLGARDENVVRLSREQLDVVLGFESAALAVSGVTFFLLRRDAIVCVVRTDSPLAALLHVDAADVQGLAQVVCLPAGIRRRGYAAAGSLPEAPAGLVTRASTTAEALCLVEAGYGFALLPSVDVAPNPRLLALPWAGSARAAYGAYVREERSEAAERFLGRARAAYAV